MFTTNLIEKTALKDGLLLNLDPGIISNVSIDSRNCGTGSLFFAFRGENVNGHDFIPELLKKGVVCVGEEALFEGKNYVRVENTLRFLSELAAARRKMFKGKVIALTGSSGKTTTREMIVSMLKVISKRVHATSGNLNNHIGLPLVILNTPLSVDYLVLEMGMNHSGEIRDLVNIADPDFSVITNIGSAHIGNFKSKEDLAKAKLEIFEHSKGVAVANTDHPEILKWVEKNEKLKKIKKYSLKCAAEIKKDVENVEGFTMENLYTAFQTVVCAVGEKPDVKKAFEVLQLPGMRGETVNIGKRIFVVDCYNANPESMKSSIDSFYRKYSTVEGLEIYLVLGSMFELGDFSKKMHEELVNYIKKLNLLKRVFLTGIEFEKLSDQILNEKKSFFLGEIEEIVDEIPESGVFLLKGSRGNKLERLLKLISLKEE